MKDIVFKSMLTCPECGCTRTEVMPTDQCVWYWRCPGCSTLLPKPGDCCVYCSFGDVPCPPVQQQGKSGCCSSSTE